MSGSWLASSDLEHATTLGGMAIALLLGAIGVPIPEEVVFAGAGWHSLDGDPPAWSAFMLGWAIVAGIDLAAFGIGRRFRTRWRHLPVLRRIPRRRWAGVRLLLRRRGMWAVAFARFVPGLRLPTFILAGGGSMPTRRFASVVLPLGVASGAWPFLLGRHIAAHGGDPSRQIETISRLLAIGALLLLMVGLTTWLLRKRRVARARV